jgi:hypothetical protein
MYIEVKGHVFARNLNKYWICGRYYDACIKSEKLIVINVLLYYNTSMERRRSFLGGK